MSMQRCRSTARLAIHLVAKLDIIVRDLLEHLRWCRGSTWNTTTNPYATEGIFEATLFFHTRLMISQPSHALPSAVDVLGADNRPGCGRTFGSTLSFHYESIDGMSPCFFAAIRRIGGTS